MMLLSRLTGKKQPQPQPPPPDEEKPKEADDPYSGFGIEEVAAPLQTDDLEYDEGFQVLHLRSTKAALHIHVSISFVVVRSNI